MEKPGYRAQLEVLNEMFPDKVALSAKEVAKVLGCDVKTVYNAMITNKNPLPRKRIGGRVIITKSALANWLA